MECDFDKVDDMVLALLTLTASKNEWVTTAWKNFDWGAMDRLHEKGFIHNPVGKSKGVTFTPEDLARANELFKKHFEK